MSEGTCLTSQAVEALIAAAYMVERFDEDPALWRVNGEVMTSAELIDEALRMGLMNDSRPLQKLSGMASNPTVSDLRKVSEVTDDEITAAVDAVLAGLASEAYPLAKGWTLDLAELVRRNAVVAGALKSDKATWKRNMLRTAILLAHPVTG